MLHEVQVSPIGISGSAQFWIEHLEPQSERPDLRNLYDNVVYACRRCNVARRFRPRIDRNGRTLLNPCLDTWASHFTIEDDQLVATSDDGKYTSEAYDLNSPAKVALRVARREAIDEATEVLATVPALLSKLMDTIDFRSRSEQREILDIAEQLHRSLAAARRTLVRLAIVPLDADEQCGCDRDACSLSPSAQAASLQLLFDPGNH